LPTEFWELNVLWLRNDYAGVVRYLDDKRDFFSKRSNRYPADERRIRSLIKLGRTDEAVEAAKQQQRGVSGEQLLALVHAARGDVSATIAALGERPSRYVISSCYTDADLGPLLRGETFKPFRDRFPEPKESKVPRFDDDD